MKFDNMEDNYLEANEHLQDQSSFRFIENYYFCMPSQGNVYTLVPLRSSTGICKILVASLQKKIICIEFVDGKYIAHENPLPCIPNGADIVSMNGFNQNNKFDVGLTAILKDGSAEAVLNLYSDWDVGRSVDSSSPTTKFTSVQLNYIPYVLYYTLLLTGSEAEIVWLLSGSDCQTHLFRFSKEASQYQEAVSKELFPEFERIRGITLSIAILYSDDKASRITATSGESGNVHLFDVDLSSSEGSAVIKASREFKFDFPSSTIKIFWPRSKVPSWSRLKRSSTAPNTGEDSDAEATNGPLVLITTTLESCFVYSAIASNGPGFELPESENYDVVTSCLVCDLDFDGVNEIVLGTYGQIILIYKQNSRSKWELIQSLPLPSPVLSLAYEDVLGDGVRELVVSTMSGVHIFQSDPNLVSSLILNRLRKIKEDTL